MASISFDKEILRKYAIVIVFLLMVVLGALTAFIGIRLDQGGLFTGDVACTCQFGDTSVEACDSGACPTGQTRTMFCSGTDMDGDGKCEYTYSVCQASPVCLECSQDSHCTNGYCEDTRCFPDRPNNATCSRDGECASDNCNTTKNICEPKGTTTPTCTIDSQCGANQYCDNGCFDKRPNGQVCSGANQCVSGICNVTCQPTGGTNPTQPSQSSSSSASSSSSSSGGGGGACSGQDRANGCNCNNDGQCSSGFCGGDNVCRRAPECRDATGRPSGCQCSTNSQCATGNCQNGQCRPTNGCDAQSGRPNGCFCGQDSRCASGNCDENINTCVGNGGTNPLPNTGLFDEDGRPLLIGLLLLLGGLGLYWTNRPRYNLQQATTQSNNDGYVDPDFARLIEAGARRAKEK